MPETSRLASPLTLLAVGLLVAGCGGDGASSGASGGDASSADDRPGDSRISDEALGSLERENVSLRLGWTIGVVNRDPTEGAGSATLREVAVEEVAGADRILLTFDSAGGVPGYRIQGSVEPATDCESGEPVPMEGQGVLLLTLRNTGLAADDRASSEVADVLRNVQAIRIICTRNDAVEWALPVETATYYRSIEATSPPRLAVDVRHPDTTRADTAGR